MPLPPSPARRLLPLPALEAADSLPHKQYDKAQLLLFAGRREMGKTTALKRYISQCEPRMLAVDPFDDLDLTVRAHSLDAAFDALEDGGPCRRRVVPSISEGTLDWGQRFFTEIVDRGLKNCLVCLDEITLWTNERDSDALRKVILQGRRLGVRIVTACQRISLVPGVMLSELTELVIFRTTRPRDLDVMKEWVGENAFEVLPKLTQGQCLVLSL